MNHKHEETAYWDRETQSSQGSAKRRAWLTVLTGTEAGRVYPLTPGVVRIGRDSGADIVLEDKQVSRQHTEIELHADGRAFVWDCSSRNGTLLGSRSIGGTPRTLRDGSKLQIGGAVVLRFSFRDRMEKHFERKLYDSATRDGLTGAFNKRYFSDSLRQEFKHAQRNGQPLALVLLDLDNFKRVNDSHGHAAGDEILRSTVDGIARTLREHEIFARYGGEEFVLLLRNSDLGSALQVAERIRHLIQAMEVEWDNKLISVTASLGVASTSNEDNSSPELLFQSADQSLYRAKRAGRNRVCGTNATGRQ